MIRRPLVVALVALALFAGCSVERHALSRPGVNQTVRVESGDRFFMDLEEDSAHGCRWDYRCNDSDVEVRIDHSRDKDGKVGASGQAHVEIRIHRGYDGPSSVMFFYKARGAKTAEKKFTISLFKRTGDCAFWK